MVQSILLDPLLSWPMLLALGAGMAVMTALALWRGLAGWGYRLLAMVALLAALLNPSLQSEDQESLSDIVFLVVDTSASQQITIRPTQTAEAIAQLTRERDIELKFEKAADMSINWQLPESFRAAKMARRGPRNLLVRSSSLEFVPR